MFLHGASDFQIVRGDTLRQPAFFSGDNLATFDCVIANPPFSLKKWGEEVWTSDPYGRNFAGMSPGKTGDYAWVQHMIKSMAPSSGRMAVVLPHGALFRIGKEGVIRKKLLVVTPISLPTRRIPTNARSQHTSLWCAQDPLPMPANTTGSHLRPSSTTRKSRERYSAIVSGDVFYAGRSHCGFSIRSLGTSHIVLTFS